MPSLAPAARRFVRIAVIALIAPGLLAAAGCGAGEPRSIDPAGVDGLEIPTATPEPADFVRGIDNPFLPLSAGSEWTYEADHGPDVVVRVADERRRIAGVTTTAVTTSVRRRRGEETSTRYYAQDRAGNVWSFGAASGGTDTWQAGIGGAQAGLVMPARPRVGDGFVQQYAAGVAEDRSWVLDVAASVSTPYGSWTDAIEIRETTALDATVEAVRHYVRGVGLVRTESDTSTLALVSFSADS